MKLSDEEKNRKVAEFIEPGPTRPGVDYAYGPDYSPAKAWIYSRHFTPTWRARDFAKDPECVLMLLEKLLDRDRELVPDDRIVDDSGLLWKRPLGAAIREAFGKSNHLWE